MMPTLSNVIISTFIAKHFNTKQSVMQVIEIINKAKTLNDEAMNHYTDATSPFKPYSNIEAYKFARGKLHNTLVLLHNAFNSRLKHVSDNSKNESDLVVKASNYIDSLLKKAEEDEKQDLAKLQDLTKLAVTQLNV